MLFGMTGMVTSKDWATAGSFEPGSVGPSPPVF